MLRHWNLFGSLSCLLLVCIGFSLFECARFEFELVRQPPMRSIHIFNMWLSGYMNSSIQHRLEVYACVHSLPMSSTWTDTTYVLNYTVCMKVLSWELKQHVPFHIRYDFGLWLIYWKTIQICGYSAVYGLWNNKITLYVIDNYLWYESCRNKRLLYVIWQIWSFLFLGFCIEISLESVISLSISGMAMVCTYSNDNVQNIKSNQTNCICIAIVSSIWLLNEIDKYLQSATDCEIEIKCRIHFFRRLRFLQTPVDVITFSVLTLKMYQ